ncbi:MAG TPA: HisA/HisF-related TIM barrel protein [Mesorhizobium sp.]
MRIIPVLDLKGGQVVRAQRGQRDLYRPISTPLAATSEPVDVARGLRTLHPFGTFYCADLDAIEGRPRNAAALSALCAMQNPPTLWLDAGVNDTSRIETILQQPRQHAVIGSESQQNEGMLSAYRNHPHVLLSLDYFAEGFRGPRAILNQTELWPARIIVMTLARVGAAAGPDFDRLAAIKARAGSREIIAAGGIRNEGDLRTLAGMGIHAALVATSLHDGTLTQDQLAAL